MDDSKPLRIVNVSMDAQAAIAGLESILARLAAELEPYDGPRMIFLPPLVANLAALPEEAAELSLARGGRLAARGRIGRRLAVRLAYPGVPGARRPWLVMHDAVHRILRGPLAGLARAAGAAVVAGTALIDHPRTHWEDWPDTGCLFHTAWSFGPDAEPCDVVRHARPTWPVLTGCGVAQSDSLTGAPLDTPAGPVWIQWSPDSARATQDAPVVWLPVAESETGTAAGAPDEAEVARQLTGGLVRAVVRTSLAGTMGSPLAGDSWTAVAGSNGQPIVEPLPPLESGLAWSEVEVALSYRGA